jgi:Helix-turn-helix domain
MKIPNPSERKQEALRASRTLHPNPSRVRSSLFQVGNFFDARDWVQVKYEMLRSVEADGLSVKRSATVFGFSRMAWYQIKAKYDQQGLVGLLPQRRGPKPHPKKQMLWLVFREITCASSMSS